MPGMVSLLASASIPANQPPPARMRNGTAMSAAARKTRNMIVSVSSTPGEPE